MKNVLLFLVLGFPLTLAAQFGVKAGLNFANVTKASSINNSSRTGFHAALFLAPESRGIISSRTELIFSRQGYDYKTNTNTGNVNLDYIMLPSYMCINITKYVQIQLGAQMAYLLNAKVDSSKQSAAGAGPESKIMNLYNRFDFGYGGGIEIHPVGGLLLGARMNISLGKLYKDPSEYANGNMGAGDFIPKVDVKNNLFQVFVGWRFGKKASKQ
jgi:Outer membrane protein beta-barrel domain